MARCLLPLMVVLMSACNGLFYFPDPVIHATPDKIGVRWRAHAITEADGTKLAVWHLLPEGAGRRAVVVHFHGNGENMSTHFNFVAWLTREGFDVVTFDYRGYGESTGSPSRAGLIADGKAVVDWVLKAPELKGRELFLFGQSLGGAVVVPVATGVLPLALAGVVVESTFDDYRHLARGKLSAFWLTWPFQYPLTWLLLSGDSNAVDAAPALTVPFLAMHGTNDPVVPMRYGKALFDAVGSKDKEFWEIPGGAHTPAFLDDDSPWRERLVQWLEAHRRSRVAP